MLNAASNSFSWSWVKVVLWRLRVGVAQAPSLLSVEPLLNWPVGIRWFEWFVFMWVFVAAATATAAATKAFESDEVWWWSVDEDAHDDDEDEVEEDKIPLFSISFGIIVDESIFWLCDKTPVDPVAIKRPLETSCFNLLNATSWFELTEPLWFDCQN